jgi:Arc/MetJ-type ribon-helix-helix transcriptional regulator
MKEGATTIELPRDVEERARARVEAGDFDDIADVVRAGLEALELLEGTDEPAPGDEWIAHARQVFQEGRAALARGESFQGSPKEIIERARARVARAAKPA